MKYNILNFLLFLKFLKICDVVKEYNGYFFMLNSDDLGKV